MNKDDLHARSRARRKLLFRPKAKCEDILKMMTATHPSADNKRTLFLNAAIRKCIDQSRLIGQLADDISTLEICAVIGRSFIETIVNGCYLQHASDEELRTYELFDVIPTQKLFNAVETKAPGELGRLIPTHHLEQFKQHVVNVTQETGKSEKDFGWTRLDIVSRCLKIDAHFRRGDAFVLLGQSIFPLAHAFVHGNYKSIERYIPSTRTDTDYYEDMNMCLYGASLAMLTLTAFVGDLRGIVLTQELQEIGTMLRTYTESLLLDLPEHWKSFSTYMTGISFDTPQFDSKTDPPET